MKKHLLTVLFAAALCVLCMVSAAAVTYTYDTGFENPVANGADPFVRVVVTSVISRSLLASENDLFELLSL